MPTECIDGGYRCGTSMPYWLTNRKEVQCPSNQYSENGFTPGCATYPNATIRPKPRVSTGLYTYYTTRMVIKTVIFQCNAIIDTKYTIDVHWYINGNEILSACYNNIAADDIHRALLHQDHWDRKYKPNMNVSCSIQLRQTGFKAPSPPQFSDDFFYWNNSYPNTTIRPKPRVSTGLYTNHTTRVVIKTVMFQCNAIIDTKYTIDVHWYINGNEILSACYNNIAADDIHRALLHQGHWDRKYKPNMNVSCSIQLRQTGFKSPSPPQFSDDFLAGIIVDYKEEQVLIENNYPKNISVRLTIPVGCSYPDIGHNKLREQGMCLVNLLGAVPDYQKIDQCIHGQVRDGLNFHGLRCGIYFNYTHWNHSQIISVSGMSDEKVNIKPLIMYLRLYVDARIAGTDKKELNFWAGFTHPDLKFSILDSDYSIYDAVCSSDNSIHMTTFDKNYYSFHKTEGEYVLYKHSNLPIEIHAYYQKCNGRALCNCGAAIRSGKSIFIVNFCTTSLRQNRYAIQKICDKLDMKITGSPSNYKISMMSGTKITMSFGLVPGNDFYGLQTFQIQASNLDMGQTSGLCGSLNGKKADDLIPKGEGIPVADPEYFAESWRLRLGQERDSLFDINNIKPIEDYAKPYCTCKKYANTFPYGEPHFSCNYTRSIDVCTRLKLANIAYNAPCKRNSFRTKRDTSSVRQLPLVREKRDLEVVDKVPGNLIEMSDDDSPVMYAMNISNVISENPDLTWKNSWTEDKARQHCVDVFQSSMSFSVCDEHIKTVPSDRYIDKCVKDIQLTGESHWDTVSVNNFATACLNVVSKLENLTKVNETSSTGEEVSIFDLIQKATCPNNCSGHGICTDGQCVCIDPYFGPTCDVEKSQAPTLYPRAFSGLCDTSFKPCHKYIIPGRNFIEGSLKCRYKQFTIHLNETTKSGALETADGIYNNPFSMQCPAPSSRHKRSTNEIAFAFGYFISVSNDGRNFTEDLTFIIYNSMCYECSTLNLTCTEKNTCQRVKVITREKSNTWAFIGAALGGAVFVIIGLVALISVKKNSLNGRSSIKDSSPSLHEKERNI